MFKAIPRPTVGSDRVVTSKSPATPLTTRQSALLAVFQPADAAHLVRQWRTRLPAGGEYDLALGILAAADHNLAVGTLAAANDRD
jgi:hypothetical protein